MKSLTLALSLAAAGLALWTVALHTESDGAALHGDVQVVSVSVLTDHAAVDSGLRCAEGEPARMLVAHLPLAPVPALSQ
ncbi:MAG: hypothetical protein AAGM22_15785 [Acidobacteriota bacterium]